MRIVWIVPEKCWGDVISMNTEYCLVAYSKDGFDYEEIFESEDLIDVTELGIHYVYEEDF